MTRGKTPLAKHRIVSRPTGGLLRSVPDQIAAVMNALASLPDRVVMVKCKGMGAPFLMQVHDVLDPYAEAGQTRSPSWREMELARYADAVQAAHGYYFTPPERTEDRVATFLRIDREVVEAAEAVRNPAPAPAPTGLWI